MSKVFTVAWRDFKQTVLTKAFLLGIVFLPLMLMIAIGGVGWLVANFSEPPLVGTVAIVTTSPQLAEAVREEFSAKQIAADLNEQVQELAREAKDSVKGPGLGSTNSIPTFNRGEVVITVEHVQDVSEASLAALKTRLRNGRLLAFASVPDPLLDVPPADAKPSDAPQAFALFIAEMLDSGHSALIERRVGQAIVRVRTQRAGMNTQQAIAMVDRPESDTTRLLPDDREVREDEGTRVVKQMIPMGFLMLLWIATFAAGQHLLMSTIEEKSNRVMEVLLSAVSPMQLMAGKILGQGAVGLVILSIYGSLGLGAAVMFTVLNLITPLSLLYLAVYFTMAYFMIASIMAAVGGAVSDMREANSLLTPVMLIAILPFLLWFPISQAPNGLIATSMSFVPPAIPFAMILRLFAEEPVPIWQVPVSMAWGFVCTIGMVWMAAKIFRVGVLMYGKPPSPMELIRWLRYS